MDAADIATSVTAMRQSVRATHLQMALLRKTVEVQSQGLLRVLATASQVSANRPHLGNLIDTTA